MKTKRKQISDFLGIKEPHLSMILKGNRNLTYDHAKKLNLVSKIEISFWMSRNVQEIKETLLNVDLTKLTLDNSNHTIKRSGKQKQRQTG